MERLGRQKTPERTFSTISLLLLGMFATHSISYAKPPTVDKDNVLARYNWTGPSLGGYIGGAWGRSKGRTNAGTVTDTSYYTTVETINAVNQSGTGAFNPNTFMGGIEFSDNFVLREHYILGLALDLGTLNLSAVHNANNRTYPDGSGTYSLQTSVNTSWVYTVRARLGYALSSLAKPVLLYTTGGLAVTNLSVTNELTDTNSLLGLGGSNNSNNQTGWTLGAGFEFPIADNLTINSEYLYMQFDAVNVKSSIYNSAQGFGIDSHALVNPFNSSANLNVNLFRVGLNYKFKSI